jgi:TorA maturation chaperone TorD
MSLQGIAVCTAALYRAGIHSPGWVHGLRMEQMQESRLHTSKGVDDVDSARAQEYALLATLLSHSPDTEMIGRLAVLGGDTSSLGMVHAALGEAASRMDEESVGREYFDLFIGLGSGLLLPYASHYLAGAVYGRPLARLRNTLQQLGIEKAAERSEPEDHVAILCEIMAGLVDGGIAARPGADREFFEEQLAPWIRRFFVDLERAQSADFYARVGTFGRIFIEVETEAFALSA